MTNFDQQGQKVLNQYNADTINVFAAQSKTITHIQWRPLEAVNYAVREDTAGIRHWFGVDVFKSLITTFEGKGYKRFTALFHPEPTTRNGQQFFLYAFLCHEIGFASTVRRLGRERTLWLHEHHGRSKSELEQAASKFQNENRVLLSPWRLAAAIDFSTPDCSSLYTIQMGKLSP